MNPTDSGWRRTLRAGLVTTCFVLFSLLSSSAVPDAAAQTSGRTFYVSSSLGNDGNSGLSESAPVRTLARLASLGVRAGDTVRFRRGDVWRETLVVPAAGTASAPVVLTTWGTGTRPVISGSNLVTSSWSVWNGSIWRTPLVGSPAAVFFDGVRGTRIDSRGALTADRQWAADGYYLYVYSSTNPGTRYRQPGIEIPVRPRVIDVDTRSYVHIVGLAAVHGNDPSTGGIRVNASEHVRLTDCRASGNVGNGIQASGTKPYPNDLRVDGCEVTDNGQSGISFLVGKGTAARGQQVLRSYVAGNGWRKNGNSHGIIGAFPDGLIEDNTIVGNGGHRPSYEHGIYITAYTGQRETFTIARNRISGHAYGSAIKVVDASGSIYGNHLFDNAYEGIGCHDASVNGYTLRISYNVIYRNGNGIREAFGGAGSKSIRIVHNTLYANKIMILNPSLRSLAIINNIIVSPTNFAYEMEYQTVATIDGNAVLSAHASHIAWYGRTPRGMSEWQQRFGFDRNGFRGDPGLAGPAQGNFALAPGSRAINAAVPVNSTYVGGGAPAIVGARADIGALEYGATQAPPAGATTDADGDGLSDLFEVQFGLNSVSASGANGPDGDPDGDGLTNLEEQRAGTHPRGTHTRYLAEGATGTFFSTRIAIANPGSTLARVLVRAQGDNGRKSSFFINIPPQSRRLIDASTVPGLASASFSTVVEADADVIVDRTMFWGPGGSGAHADSSIAAPSTTWFLAEGATHGAFDLFYLLQNPNETRDAIVDVRFLRRSGAPITKRYTVPAGRRFTIYVDEIPGLQEADVSAAFTSANGVPIIVERAMYYSTPGAVFEAGHESAAVPAPATRWFLAEGSTGSYFDTFVLIANPSSSNANVRITYLRPDGAPIVKSHTVAANSRMTINIAAEHAELRDAAVSTVVESVNGVGIVVERSMWWPAGAWQESHNAPGATKAGVRWGFADGELTGESGAETFYLIANSSSRMAQVRVTLLYEDGSAPSVREYTVPANSRFNVPVSVLFPEAAEKGFGAVIESLGASPVPIVVERAMYFNANGRVWAAGTNALGTLLN